MTPRIFVVFFFGVFMKRLNAKGCLAALITGFVLGALRLAIDTPVKLGMSGLESGYAQGSLLWIINNIYFQYFSLFIFVVSAAVMIVVSYMTEEPSPEQIHGLTLATTSGKQKAESRASWDRRDVVSSALVMLLILMAYLYFNG